MCFTGVLEAVRISCAGFPSKRPYPDFVDHFWPLAPDLLRDPNYDDKAMAKAIVKRAGIPAQGYQFGLTKASACMNHMHRHTGVRFPGLATDARCVVYWGMICVCRYSSRLEAWLSWTSSAQTT